MPPPRRPEEDVNFDEPEPILRRHYVSDITLEQLAQVTNTNPPKRGLLLHRDELAAWVLAMNQYRGGRGTDKQSWVSIWSGEPWVVDRKTANDTYVDEPFACVLGGIQPDVLPELATNREDGFVDRVLFCYPEPITPTWPKNEFNLGSFVTYDGVYRKLLNAEPAEVRPTEYATTAFGQWYDAWYAYLNAHDWGAGRGARAKMPRYCARFALILSQARGITTGELLDFVTPADVFGATVHRATSGREVATASECVPRCS